MPMSYLIIFYFANAIHPQCFFAVVISCNFFVPTEWIDWQANYRLGTNAASNIPWFTSERKSGTSSLRVSPFVTQSTNWATIFVEQPEGFLDRQRKIVTHGQSKWQANLSVHQPTSHYPHHTGYNALIIMSSPPFLFPPCRIDPTS